MVPFNYFLENPHGEVPDSKLYLGSCHYEEPSSLLLPAPEARVPRLRSRGAPSE